MLYLWCLCGIMLRSLLCFFFLIIRRPPRSTRTHTLFPYTTLFRSWNRPGSADVNLISWLPDSVANVAGKLPRKMFEASESVSWYQRRFGRLEHLRSEEHTSELQSLMRISYAVFCLKKKE